MDERLRFVARLLDGEKMAVLCREFDVSRKTGYKIFARYKDCGLEGLIDRSDGTLRGHRRSGAVVHGSRRHQAYPAVAVFVVVPAEELLAMSASVLDRAEAFGEVEPVLEGFELRFGVDPVGAKLQFEAI